MLQVRETVVLLVIRVVKRHTGLTGPGRGSALRADKELRQRADRGVIMQIVFVGGSTGQGGSPRLYRDEESGDFIVQGYLVTEASDLAQMKIPAGETVVRVPKSLFDYLPKDDADAGT